MKIIKYKKKKMIYVPVCPKCLCDYTYREDSLIVCLAFGYEWTEENKDISEKVVKDANGNVLANGDTVVLITQSSCCG